MVQIRRPSIGPGIHRPIALLICFFVASINTASRGDSATKHVLIVHGGDLSIRASTLVDPVMRETLEANSNAPVLIYTESLNALADMTVAEARQTFALMAALATPGPDLDEALYPREVLVPPPPASFWYQATPTGPSEIWLPTTDASW